MKKSRVLVAAVAAFLAGCGPQASAQPAMPTPRPSATALAVAQAPSDLEDTVKALTLRISRLEDEIDERVAELESSQDRQREMAKCLDELLVYLDDQFGSGVPSPWYRVSSACSRFQLLYY